MPRRPIEKSPEVLIKSLVDIVNNFEAKLKLKDLRKKVLALVPAFHRLRDLGSSLIPRQDASAARDRIIHYFLHYPKTMIHGDELMVISGIQDWPRRIRELRRELGWTIFVGSTLKEMISEDDFKPEGLILSKMRPDEYILMNIEPDREAAYRWKLANEIRKKKLSVRDKLLEFLRVNIGHPITGEELRYVSGDKSEWARRIRELRTEQGWPIVTKFTGRPSLPVGIYLLERDKQSPAHDRVIPDQVRRQVLMRDNYECQICGWTYQKWNPSDARNLEIHHKIHHAAGGKNEADNLQTLCSVCHDSVHSKHVQN